jgi:Nucleotidyl transferase AbiEii toxin, Type IV TA system
MNQAYQQIIASSDEDRRGLFNTAAERVGTTIRNIEKDFWVCWTLDVLFNHLKSGGPRLLFKGGTSLSKAYDLISRFSEDVDITVFRSDLGKEATLEQLESQSKKERENFLDDIKAACRDYIANALRGELEAIAKHTMEAGGKDPSTLRIVPDDQDPDRQSLLIHYPSAVEGAVYVQPVVRIESGAKSAVDPNENRTIIPYLAGDFTLGDLSVTGVTTIIAERTFLDKILILHGVMSYYGARGALRGAGRISRHYYDVHQLMSASIGETASGDKALIEDCVRHAKMFFYRKDMGLDAARRGSFRLSPSDNRMLDLLQQDYNAMSTMIFGEVPRFEAILESIALAEERLNVR